MSKDFWMYIQRLVDQCELVIDRPKGSTHHRFPGNIYPVDYGYLDGTSSMDGGGVDVWNGTLDERRVVGVMCTVDLVKKDTELKLLLDCTQDEIKAILDFVNTDQMQAIFLGKE